MMTEFSFLDEVSLKAGANSHMMIVDVSHLKTEKLRYETKHIKSDEQTQNRVLIIPDVSMQREDKRSVRCVI